MSVVASPEHDFPELRGEGREVIEAALQLINEEFQIAERLERKAREQWQLTSFMAPLAIGTALTAVGTNGVGKAWIYVIAGIAVTALGFLIATMFAASTMSDVQDEEGLNPDLLDRYVSDLHERRANEPAFDQVRADLATSLVKVARARGQGNKDRRERLTTVITFARLAFSAAAATLLAAAIAVVVNA